MSVEASKWAWEQHLPSGPKMVLLCLADHSDKKGFCWPGADGIAEKCGLTRSTVWRHLGQLEGQVLITKIRRTGINGQDTNAYQLMLQGRNTPVRELQQRVTRRRPNQSVSISDPLNFQSVPESDALDPMRVAKSDALVKTQCVLNSITSASQIETPLIGIEPSVEPSYSPSEPKKVLQENVAVPKKNHVFTLPDQFRPLQQIPAYSPNQERDAALLKFIQANDISPPTVRLALSSLAAEWEHRRYKDVWRAARNWVTIQHSRSGYRQAGPTRPFQATKETERATPPLRTPYRP